MNGTQPATGSAARQTQVSAQTAALDHELSQINELCDQLERRFDSVTRAPEPPSVEDRGVTHPEPVLVPLASDLRDSVRRAGHIRSRLKSLVNRAEL